MSGADDVEAHKSRRKFGGPYSGQHPVPTIQGYEQQRQYRQSLARSNEDADDVTQENGDSLSSPQTSNVGKDASQPAQRTVEPVYQSENKNIPRAAIESDQNNAQGSRDREREKQKSSRGQKTGDTQPDEETPKDTSQAVAGASSQKEKRKVLKHLKRNNAEREVTDPVTHLPVQIHDFTNAELKRVPQNEPSFGSQLWSATGLDAKNKSDEHLSREKESLQETHAGLEMLFPPPDLQETSDELRNTVQHVLTTTIWLAILSSFSLVSMVFLFRIYRTESHGAWRNIEMNNPLVTLVMIVAGIILIGTALSWGLHRFANKKMQGVWESEVWESKRRQGQEQVNTSVPESVEWLNSLVGSIWPLVNPDLFTSLADTLEDVMQASLPKLVRMVSVEDLGQGSEALRILGVKWLPTGAAARSVSLDGQLKSQQSPNDRMIPGASQETIDDSTSTDQGAEGESGGRQNSGRDTPEDEETVAEGMEAEEGDFVNVEIAFAYRARPVSTNLRNKAKNAHLYIAFYLPGGLRFPVWVELRGLVGCVRMRLQLTPDPPFIALSTFTFLGQPKVDLSCVPLTSRGLNIMDLPLISSFVQSSVDAAMAEYVAPKSLTLDLKDMLIGDDFKKDVLSYGVVVVHIKRAMDFKEGDPGFGVLKEGTADPYVSVAWAKFGKPVWSTRLLLNEMKPVWDEMAFVLVGPEEVNAEERLRLQLWDSDRYTADDDLGRIEVDLKTIMKSPKSNGSMWDRTDDFQALDSKESMPGRLEWSIGYYSKTPIQPCQIQHQNAYPEIKSIEQLKEVVSDTAQRKLREASNKDEACELEQIKAQDMKTREDSMIISSPPPDDYPSGIFSIQVHQITGLELEKIKKQRNPKDQQDVEGVAGDLPSSYCNIILNHQTIFQTRTKPKNPKPFFNAGTERFIRNWRNTEVIVAVRDSRVHEDDPLLGIIVLPLGKIFENRSQVNDLYPLAGGLGYGRARISMVFRSVQLQPPKELLGWEYGTLEIRSGIKSKDLPHDLSSLRLSFRTSAGKAKMHSSRSGVLSSHHSDADDTTWNSTHSRRVYLAVRKRYSTCLLISFRRNALGPDKTPAFSILWLKDVPDDEPRTLDLPVYRSSEVRVSRARSNCLSAEELPKPVGYITLSLIFYHGLSAHHISLARSDSSVGVVCEVLETAQQNYDSRPGDGTSSDEDSNEASDNSESDSGDDDNEDGEKQHDIGDRGSTKLDDHKTDSPSFERPSGPSMTSNTHRSKRSENLQASGKRGPIDTIRDYQVHRKQLHHSHRGAMQWRAPRTMAWALTKVKNTGTGVVGGIFKRHGDREPDIETEV
ncbi:hypothetical protein L228DRAFT_267074 [Xylona heveae TC161]|uniref:C2 domain protein n=1 Tax=Xylona heveae (strain CBS 132557 / TC161) TaxID=1328760 RepID=A0A165IE56_XYLHT|nr:hypothetical protein L228DRAFT_267074 [Xylona heveae TC161]KZF24768.1 hypothetical protein L228DRAFT_267074 [Xylona heveae TC161]